MRQKELSVLYIFVFQVTKKNFMDCVVNPPSKRAEDQQFLITNLSGRNRTFYALPPAEEIHLERRCTEIAFLIIFVKLSGSFEAALRQLPAFDSQIEVTATTTLNYVTLFLHL